MEQVHFTNLVQAALNQWLFSLVKRQRLWEYIEGQCVLWLFLLQKMSRWHQDHTSCPKVDTFRAKHHPSYSFLLPIIVAYFHFTGLWIIEGLKVNYLWQMTGLFFDLRQASTVIKQIWSQITTEIIVRYL